jgi:hypothetical protein
MKPDPFYPSGNWMNGMFGYGNWLGQVLPVPAETSDLCALGGTTAASVPLGIGIFAGGEVVLGVGTFGGSIGAGSTATTFTISGHALQRMLQRGISRKLIEQALAKGITAPGNTAGTTVYSLSASSSCTGRGVQVVINNVTRNVITVIDKGTKFAP